MLPPAFVARLERLVPPERLATVLASFALEKPPCLWLPPFRADPATTLAELTAALPPASLRPLFDSSPVDPAPHLHAYVVDADPAVLSHLAAVTEGRAYLINPSSLIPATLLAPTPDDAVLDLCAAPGGKTLQLAAHLARSPGTGHLAAVESVKPRFFKLRGVLDRYGALPGVRLFMKDGRDVGGAVPERFDKVLVDAPCSSEARFDADDATTTRHWSEHKIAECAFKQKALLRSALTALKVGGTLVYCTCSFAPEENEAVVVDALDAFPESLSAIPSPLPATTSPIPAIPSPDLPEAWRILPDALWDGFFLVRLRKHSPLSSTTSAEKRNTSRPKGRADKRRHP